jgi:hypothetical protein
VTEVTCENMNAAGSCPKCGKRLPADAPRGHCPDCVLGLLDSEEGRRNGQLFKAPLAAALKRRQGGGWTRLRRLRIAGRNRARRHGRCLSRAADKPRPHHCREDAPSGGRDKGLVQRFRTESLLPPVCNIRTSSPFTSRLCRGQHFFAMDFVVGDSRNSRPKARCQLGSGHVSQDGCRAIHFAHGGTCSIAISPSNVLIDPHRSAARDRLRIGQAPGSRD